MALDAEALASQLQIGHFMLAHITKMPELVISEDEAKSLSIAAIGFAKEFDFVPDPKITAAITLIATIGMIYVPRVMQIKSRHSQIRAARNKPPASVNEMATELEIVSGADMVN